MDNSLSLSTVHFFKTSSYNTKSIDKNKDKNKRNKNDIFNIFKRSSSTDLIQQKNKKKIKIASFENSTNEIFVQKVIQNLKDSLDLAEKNSDFYWLADNRKPIRPTGQNRKDLEKHLRTIKSNDQKFPFVAIRFKRKISDKNKTRETNIGIVDLIEGNVVKIIKKIKVVGQGGYSKVYSYIGDEELDDSFYALKLTRTREKKGLIPKEKKEETELEFIRDISMLKFLHKNKVPSIQPAPQYTFTLLRGQSKGGKDEASKLGSLGILYSGDAAPSRKTFDRKAWGTENLVESLKNIALSLFSCHSLNVYHGDVKPHNILRSDKHNTFHLADMGGTCLIGTNGLPLQFSHTPMFTHINDYKELTRQSENNDKKGYCFIKSKMDVFSFGATCYQILTGNMPYPFNRGEHITEAPFAKNLLIEEIDKSLHLKSKTSFKKRKEIASKIGALIHKMVDIDYKKRPNMEEAVEELSKIF